MPPAEKNPSGFQVDILLLVYLLLVMLSVNDEEREE